MQFSSFVYFKPILLFHMTCVLLYLECDGTGEKYKNKRDAINKRGNTVVSVNAKERMKFDHIF